MQELENLKLNSETVDVRERSLFARLRRLFSTEVIVRNIGGKKLKIKDTGDIMKATDRNSLRDRFNRIRSTAYNAYTRDFALSYQAARIDLFRDYDCVGPNTIVPLPDGTRPTIKELAEKYKDRPQERFYVYSYDHETDSIKLGKAYHPRKKEGGTREGFKVTFDDGQYVIGSIKHPFLMGNGEYKKIFDLKVGEFVMPFRTEWGDKCIESEYNYKFHRALVEDGDYNKVKSIESIGPIDVYDVTVEKYQNFCCDSCILHNTMDMDPIISSALDIYADECLTSNEMGNILTVKCENNNIKQILYNLYYDILNIEFNLWSWTRNLAKYGDFYIRNYISPEYGVFMVEPVSAYNVERVENSDPSNKSYVKFQIRPTDTSQIENVESFELTHFRLISDSNFLPYGKSLIEGARRVWKQLSLMEDAMLIHRIMRAPEKRIFKVDIGNLPPGEIDNFMERFITNVKKVPYVDEKTGDYNLRFNLQNMVEDFYLPVRGGDSGTEIDTLGGLEWTGIDDIEYLRNKLMAALKIPKPFLGYDENVSGKATLASEDVRFARTIERIQKVLISGLTQIAIIHLYAQGYRDSDLVNFELELTNPSTIFEKEKLEILSDKVDVATSIIDNKILPKSWIYQNIFDMASDEIETARDGIIEDSKESFRLTKITEEGNDPASPFKKIPSEEEDEEGGGESGPPELGGMGEEPGGEGPGGEPGGEEALQEAEKSDKDNDEYERPSQEGEKDARDYPFGEDPLGSLENDTDERESLLSIGGRFNRRKGSPRFEEKMGDKHSIISKTIPTLAKKLPNIPKRKHKQVLREDDRCMLELMSKTKEENKKDLLKDNLNKKSMLDESNIIE